MASKHQRDMTFERLELTPGSLDDTEFENCVFVRCDFSGFVATDANFVDCRFEGCNLANFRPNGCGLKQVVFADCKLVGVDFTLCTEFAFAVGFARCNLDFTRFAKMPLTGTLFDACLIREANFGGANLTKARFDECNLDRSVFHRTNLSQADFRSASNFAIDPESNQLKKAKFAATALAGLLGKYGLVIE
jgi:fluoroquinolone resistance protein